MKGQEECRLVVGRQDVFEALGPVVDDEVGTCSCYSCKTREPAQ